MKIRVYRKTKKMFESWLRLCSSSNYIWMVAFQLLVVGFIAPAWLSYSNGAMSLACNGTSKLVVLIAFVQKFWERLFCRWNLKIERDVRSRNTSPFTRLKKSYKQETAIPIGINILMRGMRRIFSPPARSSRNFHSIATHRTKLGWPTFNPLHLLSFFLSFLTAHTINVPEYPRKSLETSSISRSRFAASAHTAPHFLCFSY